ncbi:hypothetical protein [Luteolibacter sp. LG18]|uniref:hypothetical protein n=1 Tax=Luteolibacter sp. LG18 TaxID=2819286 RepID=UPI002B290321|nr:hypothetical protein llg_37900 [Luteolibacter sp. LG18]
MKTFLSFSAALLVLPCAAETAAKPTMRDAVTAEELTRRAQQQRTQPPTVEMKPVELAVDPSVANRPGDILTRSDIFCFAGRATLVPKRAILHTPAAYASRLGFKEGSNFQSWSEFLSDNRGWIITQEVSRPQAEGREALPDDVQKSLAKSPYIVVATFHGDPISVLPLKTAPAPTAATPVTGKP